MCVCMQVCVLQTVSMISLPFTLMNSYLFMGDTKVSDAVDWPKYCIVFSFTLLPPTVETVKNMDGYRETLAFLTSTCTRLRFHFNVLKIFRLIDNRSGERAGRRVATLATLAIIFKHAVGRSNLRREDSRSLPLHMNNLMMLLKHFRDAEYLV